MYHNFVTILIATQLATHLLVTMQAAPPVCVPSPSPPVCPPKPRNMTPWQGCILNPKTGRAIKIGSNTYLKLVRDGDIAPLVPTSYQPYQQPSQFPIPQAVPQPVAPPVQFIPPPVVAPSVDVPAPVPPAPTPSPAVIPDALPSSSVPGGDFDQPPGEASLRSALDLKTEPLDSDPLDTATDPFQQAAAQPRDDFFAGEPLDSFANTDAGFPPPPPSPGPGAAAAAAEPMEDEGYDFSEAIRSGFSAADENFEALGNQLGQMAAGGDQVIQGLSAADQKIGTMGSQIQQMAAGGEKVLEEVNQTSNTVQALASQLQQMGQQLQNRPPPGLTDQDRQALKEEYDRQASQLQSLLGQIRDVQLAQDQMMKRINTGVSQNQLVNSQNQLKVELSRAFNDAVQTLTGLIQDRAFFKQFPDKKEDEDDDLGGAAMVTDIKGDDDDQDKRPPAPQLVEEKKEFESVVVPKFPNAATQGTPLGSDGSIQAPAAVSSESIAPSAVLPQQQTPSTQSIDSPVSAATEPVEQAQSAANIQQAQQEVAREAQAQVQNQVIAEQEEETREAVDDASGSSEAKSKITVDTSVVSPKAAAELLTRLLTEVAETKKLQEAEATGPPPSYEPMVTETIADKLGTKRGLAEMNPDLTLENVEDPLPLKQDLRARYAPNVEIGSLTGSKVEIAEQEEFADNKLIDPSIRPVDTREPIDEDTDDDDFEDFVDQEVKDFVDQEELQEMSPTGAPKAPTTEVQLQPEPQVPSVGPPPTKRRVTTGALKRGAQTGRKRRDRSIATNEAVLSTNPPKSSVPDTRTRRQYVSFPAN